jgi:signal transduction histidine kinase
MSTLTTMWRPARTDWRWAADAALALVFFGLAVLELTRPVEEMHQHSSLGVDVALQAVICATLVLRTHYPRVTVVAITAGLLLPSLATPHAVLFFGDFVPFLVVTWTVTRRSPEEWSRLAWLTGVVFWAAVVLRSGHYFAEVRNPLLVVGVPLAVWSAARIVRRLDLQRTDLARALDQLEAEQAAREQDAVALERSRVAAEMHDVVAHAVTLMVVQVGDARIGLERDGFPRERLRVAEATGRQALVELRRCLGVLRTPHPEPGPVEDELERTASC